MCATHERAKVRVHREHEGFEEEAAVQRNGLEIDGLRGVVDRGLARDWITWEKNQRSLFAQEPMNTRSENTPSGTELNRTRAFLMGAICIGV